MGKFNFLVLALLVVSLGFTGCKKDDDDDAKVIILGKWQMTKEVWKDYNPNGSIANQGTETDVDYAIEFKSNGSYTVYYQGDIEETGTYSIQNDGKKLVFNNAEDDIDDIHTINSLTSSQLVLYQEDSETVGGQTTKSTYELTFNKQ
jgi:hypothetical protein